MRSGYEVFDAYNVVAEQGPFTFYAHEAGASITWTDDQSKATRFTSMRSAMRAIERKDFDSAGAIVLSAP